MPSQSLPKHLKRSGSLLRPEVIFNAWKTIQMYLLLIDGNQLEGVQEVEAGEGSSPKMREMRTQVDDKEIHCEQQR